MQSRKVRRYKLFSIDRFSYIVPIMAGYNGRKNLVLYASNYIVHLYPTAQEDAPVLIEVTAYSDSVNNTERVLASTFSLPTPNNYKASCLAPCLNLLEVQAATEEISSNVMEKLAARLRNLNLGTLRNMTSRLFDLEVLPNVEVRGLIYAPVSFTTRLISNEELGE